MQVMDSLMAHTVWRYPLLAVVPLIMQRASK